MFRVLFVSGLCTGLFLASDVFPNPLGAQQLANRGAPREVTASVIGTQGMIAPGPHAPSDSARAGLPASHVGLVALPGAARWWGATNAPERRGRYTGATNNVELIGLGAAGVVTGLLLGGNGGEALVIGGGIVGLYGLYRLFR